MKLCYCNQCEILLEDKNPQTGAKEYPDLPVEALIPSYEGENQTDPVPFWACPKCLDDGGLTDDVEEPGAAQIVVTLEDSKIIVRHTNPTGRVLLERIAFKGAWKKLWDALSNKTS